jgi:ABC-type phosphate transport system substrate-binding protein
MKFTRPAALFSAVGALCATVALAAGPASADPGTPTDYRQLAGTGSDTTQSVMNSFGNKLRDGSLDRVIASYDATGSAQIKVSAPGPTFNRPNGSTNGVKALTASINPTGTYLWGGVNIAGQLDFARSSSAPSSSTPGTVLTYIPFARDAVSYAYADLGNQSIPANLSKTEIANIYRGVTTTFVDAGGATRTYKPILPQAGSGTRSFFLSSIGITEAQLTPGLPTVQENDGSQIDAVGEIVPFSVAAWIAQDNAASPNTIDDNGITLGSVDTVAPLTADFKLNPSFGMTRLVFNVVETSRLSGTNAKDTLLQDTFAGPDSQVCSARATLSIYGFAAIGSQCGNTTTFKSGYVAP